MQTDVPSGGQRMRMCRLASWQPRRRFLLFAAVLSLAGGALAGCRDHVDPSKHGIVFSPNGQPLSGGSLGHPDCPDALGGWYDRLTQGRLLMVELFTADARRQFAAMDVDHAGLLTPAGLSRYRTPYFYKAESPDKGSGKRKHRPEGDDDDRGDRLGRFHDSSDDFADPVMSADLRNRNEVSLGDFITYARQNFVRLDKNHDGRLSREELLDSCPH